MGKRAAVTMFGPRTASEKLLISGYASASALAGGPLRLTILAGGLHVASALLTEKDKPFAIQSELPAALIGKYSIEVVLECSRTFRPPNDSRDLGLVISSLEVR